MRRIAQVGDIALKSSAWLDEATDSSVVVSCRVRLARNIAGEKFPWRCDEPDLTRLWKKLTGVVSSINAMDKPVVIEMESLNWTDRHVLQERHIISVEMTDLGRGSGVVLRRDERVSVMVNEEDHIRIQVMSPGMNLEKAHAVADEIDTEIGECVRYGFSPRLGYLTSCPSNVGTGMRASVMLHLPGLGLHSEIDPVIKGLGKIGVAVRGLLGEGTDASGNMFQISNQTTLGESEAATIKRMSGIVAEIVGHERNARLRLVEKRLPYVQDYVGRSHGVLLNCRMLTSQEAMDLLSSIWLGLELGMVDNVSERVIHELIILTQPGHMQRMAGMEFSPEQRDELRSKIVRDKLAGMILCL